MNKREQIADAIDSAEFGYSIMLTRLVDGEATYTLDLKDGTEAEEFSSHEEATERLGQLRSLTRADAALDAIRIPTEAQIRAVDAALHDKWPNAREMALATCEALVDAARDTDRNGAADETAKQAQPVG